MNYYISFFGSIMIARLHTSINTGEAELPIAGSANGDIYMAF